MSSRFIVAFVLLLACSAVADERSGAPEGLPKVLSGANVAVRAENEEFLRQYAQTYRFSLGRPRNARVTEDGSAVLFLRSGPRSFVQDLYEFDCTSGRERVLLTAEQVLAGGDEQLSAEEKALRERLRLAARGIARYDLSDEGTKVLVPLS